MGIFRGLRYARHYVNWRELERERSRGGWPTRALLRNGLRFESPANTNILRVVGPVFYKRYYTVEFLGDIGPDDVVLDVGANIGSFSIFAALRTRREVVAVEPCPTNLEFLRRNLHENGITNVRVIAQGLADCDGKAQLQLNERGVGHTLSGQGRDVVEIETSSLPSLLDEVGVEQIDLLKLDCEGAEGLAIPSTPDSYLRRIRRIAMEFHDDTSPVHHDELRKRLDASGMETQLVWNGRDVRGYIYARR